MTAKPFNWSRLLGVSKASAKEESMTTTGGSSHAGEPVEVFLVANDLEAQVIKTFLESNDIPVMLQGDAVSKIYGFTVGMMAEVRVYVPAPLAPRALELLEAAQEESGDDADSAGESA